MSLDDFLADVSRMLEENPFLLDYRTKEYYMPLAREWYVNVRRGLVGYQECLDDLFEYMGEAFDQDCQNDPEHGSQWLSVGEPRPINP
jgi:hypothetical protein